MQVKQLKQDGLNHELEITVKAGDIDKRVDVKLQEVGKTVRMPGFRPGKVPLPLLKKRYGKAILGEVLEQTVNETSMKAMDEKGLKPAIQPKIEVKSFDEGKDLTYTMALEVLPDFKVKDFKGIKLEKPVARPDEKSVDEALERIAAQRQDTKPVEEKRATKKGDVVIINFHGRTADDNKEHPGMHAHGHQLELGGGQFIPGFEEQLIGKKAGDKVEVKVKFPEKYGAKELAGREAVFDVNIEEIRKRVPATIDDDFAKSFGMDDLKALRKAIEEQIGREFDAHSRMKVKKALLDHLDAQHDFEIPRGMLEMEYKNIVQQLELEQQRQQSDAKLSEEEKEELKQIAERRVRLGLILSDIGTANKITVSDPELQKAVITEAQRFPGQEREVFDFYAKNRNALESLRAPLFEDKVVDFILELAEIKEVTVTPEELTAEEDEESTPKKPKKKAASKKDGNKSDKKDSKPKAKKESKKAS